MVLKIAMLKYRSLMGTAIPIAAVMKTANAGVKFREN